MITQGIKGFTAYQINALQRMHGRIFWQDESYDHWARDEEEMLRIIEYLERNPVAAGLCSSPSEWPWSSARWRSIIKWKHGAALTVDAKQRILEECTSSFLA